MVQASQELLIIFDRGQLDNHPSIELGRVVRGVSAQPVILQPTPQRLGWVEHRRPRRQGLEAQAVGEVVRESLDRVAFVTPLNMQSKEFD